MGALADALAAPPGRVDEVYARLARVTAERGDAVLRAWRLWMEAERCRRAGWFSLAGEALTAAEGVATSLPQNPLWSLESRGLRARLLQDGGEPAIAYEHLQWVLDGWLHIGRAFHRPDAEEAALTSTVLRSAATMVVAIVGEERLGALARTMPGVGASIGEVALSLWILDRMVPEVPDTAARTVALTGVTRSYAAAVDLLDRVMTALGGWELPEWDPLLVEIRLRQALGGAASDTGEPAGALAQADRGLALVTQLPDGPVRRRTVGELRANRGGALLALGRAREALPDYEESERAFEAVGAVREALRARVGTLLARSGGGERVGGSDLRALIGDFESAHGFPDDLELLRRWYLAELADTRSGDLDEIVGLIEALRADVPPLRSGSDHDDPVVARLSQPFTVLGARLARLPSTLLLVLEPGLVVGTRREPLLFAATVDPGSSAPRWWLLPCGEAGVDALTALSEAVRAEREMLLTGEIPLHSAPSAALAASAAAAWGAIPEEIRVAVAAASTVVYMPSARGRLDAIPLELLRHPGGWLGATHAVARCPSFQYLEQALAPNARPSPEPEHAVVLTVPPDEPFDELPEAERDVETAMRAASLLGLRAERLRAPPPEQVLQHLSEDGLVHYVGHGFANELGEFLPLTDGLALSASNLADAGSSGAPFVFFNACLLGRVRHTPGGGQKGWAVTLLERGAPGVVGALYPVPDRACPLAAEAFYRGALQAPAGEAMRRARVFLEERGVHPLVWGAYVLHGDPNAVLARSPAPAPRSSRDLVRRWPALLTRWLATGLTEDRRRLADSLGPDPLLAARPGAGDVVLTAASAARGAGVVVDTEALGALVGALAEADAEAAAGCRTLLALVRTGEPARCGDAVGELETAYLAAAGLGDGYAVLAVLDRYLDTAGELTPDRRHGALKAGRWWLGALAADRAAVARFRERFGEPDRGGEVAPSAR